MGFHEGAPVLRGGFIGVDIFFVLSGFLITDLLMARYGQTGRLDLKDFWTRRARRLLPALAVMLIVVAAAAAVIEPGQEASLRLALLAAATYTSNWFQILHRVSYFAAVGNLGVPAPLDHLWSLAIEEQFYLIWPVLLLFVVARLRGQVTRVMAALLGAAGSAMAMAVQYVPGGDPSAVYYGTDTHASALLIGAALALACPLSALASVRAARARRLDAAGIAGLVVLALAAWRLSGGDPAVYPTGLILAALAAAVLVAAAAGNGLVAAVAGLPPLRWMGVRSYGIYLWHWPVIALGAALARPDSGSSWRWLPETAVTIALAAASWRFVESPILRDGLGVTLRRWRDALTGAVRRPGGAPTGAVRRPGDALGRAVPAAVAAATAVVLVLAGYGVVRPQPPAAPSGLLRQVANGQRVSAASEATTPGAPGSPDVMPTPRPSPAVPRAACHRGQPRISGGQVIAVGDSVMLASAAALAADLPGIYIDAQVSRQMSAGIVVLEQLAAAGRLRPIVVVALGTNGTVTADQLGQIRRIIGPGRELVLVSTFGPQPWEHEVNAALTAAVMHARDTELADWARAIAPRPYLLWPDGIHPRPSGGSLYARVVLAAIGAGRPSCPQPAVSRKPVLYSTYP